jgi:hypothetical protein
MQTFLQRFIWISIWLGTMGITLGLCYGLAERQPILLAIIVLAAIVQSVAFVYARIHSIGGNRYTWAATLWVGLLALCVSVVAGTSYWSSTIANVHDEIARDRAQLAGQDIIQDKRREQLGKLTAGRSPAAIEADMQLALAKSFGKETLGFKTADCSDTSSPHYRYCTEFLSLKSQLASAKELKELEGKVLADSTRVVSVAIKRSFYDLAILGSENIGGSVKMWILGIVVLIEACLQSLHLLSLYIGFAPVRRREALAAPKAEAAPSVAEKASSRVSEPLEKPRKSLAAPMTLGEIERIYSTSPEDPRDPPPSGGKPDPLKGRTDLTRKADNPPSEKVVQPEAKQPAARLVVDNDPPILVIPQPPRKKKEKRLEGNVMRWISECTSQTPDKRVKATSQECRRSYLAWCRINGFEEIGHKKMSRIMSVELRRGDSSARGPRNGKGAVWPGLLVSIPNAEPLRRRA